MTTNNLDLDNATITNLAPQIQRRQISPIELTEATIQRMERLQPILMTSIASLAGFFPLVIAQNAGANAQQAIGTVVFGGLLMGTTLSLLVVPPMYVLIKSLEAKIFSRHSNSTQP